MFPNLYKTKLSDKFSQLILFRYDKDVLNMFNLDENSTYKFEKFRIIV